MRLLPLLSFLNCSWNYRFDSYDNHFNIVYPDKNAVYFGMVIPPGTTNFRVLSNVIHPVATYFSIQVYEIGGVAYHFNDVELLTEDGLTHIGTPYDLQLNLTPLIVGMSEEYFSKLVSELTHNAFKFSKTGTPVSVTLATSGETVVLTVSDRGRGMSADQIGKIGAFMQFDRKTHEQQGLGLGFTVARRLAEIHGGALTVQSELGVRTIATVKLPGVS